MSIAPGQNAATGMPPAGWYADPSGGGQRWWDGAQWTSHVQPVAVATPGPDTAVSSGPAAAPAPVTATASWTPEPSNPLDPSAGFEGYAVTPRSGPHRGPGGYVAPTAYADLSAYNRTATVDVRGFGGSAAYPPGAYAPLTPPTGQIARPAPPYVSAAPTAPAVPFPYAPGLLVPKNTRATIGFVLGVVFVSIGVLFGYWFGSLIAVVVSITGLTRARGLAAQGYPAVGRSLAIWGIVLSALSWVVAVGLRLAGYGL